METLIPIQFLFRCTFRCPKLPAGFRFRSDRVTPLPKLNRLPFLGTMDRESERYDVEVGWLAEGLFVAIETRFRTTPLVGEADRPGHSDGLTLWLDTRDTRTIQRATRFCHQFIAAAHDGGNPPTPRLTRKPIGRALEFAPDGDLSSASLHLFKEDGDGDWEPAATAARVKNYRLELFLPAAGVHGFDPSLNNRLGLFYRIRDQELGDQLLSTGRELPYWENPSLWAVLQLTESKK